MKEINASIWLSQDYPITIVDFLPLLHILSFSSKQIGKFRDYLIRYKLPDDSFPLQANIPLFLSMKADFSLQNLCFNP